VVFTLFIGGCNPSSEDPQSFPPATWTPVMLVTLTESATVTLTGTPIPTKTIEPTSTPVPPTFIPMVTRTFEPTATYVPPNEPLIIVMDQNSSVSLTGFLKEILPLVKKSKYLPATFQTMHSVRYPLIFIFNQVLVFRWLDDDIRGAFELLNQEGYPAMIGVITFIYKGAVPNTLEVIKKQVSKGWQIATDTERNVPIIAQQNLTPFVIAWDIKTSLQYISSAKGFDVITDVLVLPEGVGGDYPGLDKIIANCCSISYVVGYTDNYGGTKKKPVIPTDITRFPPYYRAIHLYYDNKQEIKAYFK
jgi:hypothetical protein